MLFLERARAKRSEQSALDDGGLYGNGKGGAVDEGARGVIIRQMLQSSSLPDGEGETLGGGSGEYGYREVED